MYDEEEEGEYLDDPISLVFNGIDADAVVDLSTSSDEEAEDPRLEPRSSYGIRSFCLPVTFFDITRNVELLKKCQALSIKLVDCDKHPSKYKYTCKSKQPQSHVVTSSELDKLSFDKESKTDATKDKSLANEELDKKPDKILVKDKDAIVQKSSDKKKEKTTNKIRSDLLQKVSCQKIVVPIIKCKKTKLEYEKQQALKCKDLSQVDFKRNTGLVGLTISKKNFPKEVNVANKTVKKIKKNIVSNGEMEGITEALKSLDRLFIPFSNKNPKLLKVADNVSCSNTPLKEVSRPLLDAKNQLVKNNENSPTYCSLKITSSKLLEKALKLKQARDPHNKESPKEIPKENDKNTVQTIAEDHKHPIEINPKDEAVPKLNLKRKYTETNVLYIIDNASDTQHDDPNNKTNKPQEPQKRDKAVDNETNENDLTRSSSPILPCTTNINTSIHNKKMQRKKTKKTLNGRNKAGPLSSKSNTHNFQKTLQANNIIHRYTPSNIVSKSIVGVNQIESLSVPLKNQVNSSAGPRPVALNSHITPHVSSQINMKGTTPLKSAIVNEKYFSSRNGPTKEAIAINSRPASEVAVNMRKAGEDNLSGEGCKSATIKSLPNFQVCQNRSVNNNSTLARILQTSPKSVVSLQKGNETNVPGGHDKNMTRNYTPPCPNERRNNVLPVKRVFLQAAPNESYHPGQDYRSEMMRVLPNTQPCANNAVNSIPPQKRAISESAPECAVNLPKRNEVNLPGEGYKREIIKADNNSVLKTPIYNYSPGNNANRDFQETPPRPLHTSIHQNDGRPIETMVNHRPQVQKNSDLRQSLGRSVRILGPWPFPPPNTNIVPPGVKMSHNNPASLCRLPFEPTNVLSHQMPPSFWRPAILRNQYYPPGECKPWWPPLAEKVNISEPAVTHARVEVPKESILGSDANGELIKKINIVGVPACYTAQIKNKEKPLEVLNHSIEEQINAATPTILEKIIEDLRLKKVDVRPTTKSNSCKPCPLSKKNKTNNLVKPTIAQNVAKDVAETLPTNGYSPPILPIPTYQQAFDIIAKKEKEIHEAKNHIALPDEMKLDNFIINSKIPKQYKSKKISIDEYKKRINDSVSKSKDSKRKCKTQDVSKGVTVDNSQDLGYDSDSTFIHI